MHPDYFFSYFKYASGVTSVPISLRVKKIQFYRPTCSGLQEYIIKMLLPEGMGLILASDGYSPQSADQLAGGSGAGCGVVAPS